MAAAPKSVPKTAIARHTNEKIFVRNLDLLDEVVGKMNFTTMFFHQIMARLPTPQESAVLDAVLVTLMEHGLTPSAIVARMTIVSAPEASQGAIAAGLLGVGSQFIGTIEDSAKLMQQLVAAPEGVEKAAAEAAQRYRSQKLLLPGFGHHLHRPDDPRSPVLLGVAEKQGMAGKHITALRVFAREVDKAYGKHITINATGAIGAILSDLGIPIGAIRGIAIVARAAGLVGHILEEQTDQTTRFIWDMAEEHIEHTAAPGR